MKIKTEHERAVEELFHRAVLLTEDEREGWLAVECAGDPALRAEVEVLLCADGRVAPEFLERAGAAIGTWFESGEQLGDYTIRERLGQGGMGVVYLAREAKLERDVALKIVRPDLLFFGHGRERLRREVDAIARLKHANILPVYSAGEEAGVPFFTMEFVEGCTLSEVLGYLNRRRPAALTAAALTGAIEELSRKTVGERPGRRAQAQFGLSWTEAAFRIALAVAEALEHAHERGILHRDVKPSNVMLTRDGRVLLLDFGLAASSEPSELTLTGFPVGTLPYMAPERLRGDAEPSGVKGDVYAAGVLLFELLTLRSPYLAPNAEVMRARILEASPPPIRSLNPQVPWDAETVCLTAMDRDPARRYASAAALAEDLANVLEHRPIRARRPGALLRARRFTERHPVASVAAALGLLLLVGSAAFAAVQVSTNRELRAANSDKDTALARKDQLSAIAWSLLGAPDYWNTDSGNPVAGETTVMEVLDLLRIKLEEEELEPAVAVEACTLLGRAYDNLGLPERAEPLLLRARELANDVYGAEARESLVIATHIGSARHHRRNDEQAIEILEPTLERAERFLEETDSLLWDLRNQLALCHGPSPRAEELYLSMLATQPDMPEDEGALYRALACHNLGSQLMSRGALDEAEPLLREALDLRRSHLPIDHPRVLNSENAVGALWLRQGRFDEAWTLFEELPEKMATAYGEHHERTLVAVNNLAWACSGTGRFARGEELARGILALVPDVLSDEHSVVLTACMRLAQNLEGQGRREEAAALEHESGRGFLKSGNLREAEPALRAAFTTCRELHGIEDPKTQAALADLVRCLDELDRDAKADELRRMLAVPMEAVSSEQTGG